MFEIVSADWFLSNSWATC